jgi:hypothetical protein
MFSIGEFSQIARVTPRQVFIEPFEPITQGRHRNSASCEKAQQHEGIRLPTDHRGMISPKIQKARMKGVFYEAH